MGLDPPPLAGAAAVVGLGRHVADARDLQAGGLERTDRGLAAGAGTLDEDLDLLEALLHALLGGGVGRDLGREGRRLARALETGSAGGLPGDPVPPAVRERHDRVVEARLDVGLPDWHVLARLAAPTRPSWSLLSHQCLRTLRLPEPAACPARGPLRARAFVLVRWPLTGNPRRWRRPR